MNRSNRRAFSLLEVMIALAILTVTLVILVEIQATAAYATRTAENFVTGTDLAYTKLAEAQMLLEMEGFTESEIYEQGDFDDLGDDVLNAEMGDELEDFHFEFGVQEIDIQLAGDIASMAGDLGGSGAFGEGGGDAGGGIGDALGGLPGGGGLGALMSPEMISTMLSPYIREIRVRVYWDGDSKEAEELGNEVILVTHVINPSGKLAQIGEGITP